MAYLRFFSLADSDVQHVLCSVFILLRLVYPMLSASIDCPFLIAPSPIYNVYLRTFML